MDNDDPNNLPQALYPEFRTCIRYCLLKEFVPQAEALRQNPKHNIPPRQINSKVHLTRMRIEEICECNLECPLKELAAHIYDDCVLTQMHCIEIFKLDRSKYLQREISWDEAMLGWAFDLIDDRVTYAFRFRKLWQAGSRHFTDLCMYQIIVGSSSTYQIALQFLKLLEVEVEGRIHGF